MLQPSTNFDGCYEPAPTEAPDSFLSPSAASQSGIGSPYAAHPPDADFQTEAPRPAPFADVPGVAGAHAGDALEMSTRDKLRDALRRGNVARGQGVPMAIPEEESGNFETSGALQQVACIHTVLLCTRQIRERVPHEHRLHLHGRRQRRLLPVDVGGLPVRTTLIDRLMLQLHLLCPVTCATSACHATVQTLESAQRNGLPPAISRMVTTRV